MSRIFGHLFVGETGKVVPRDDALGKRFGQTVMAKRRLSSVRLIQQQARAVFGIHSVVGEQTRVFENLVAWMMGLLDDEYGALSGFQGGRFKRG